MEYRAVSWLARCRGRRAALEALPAQICTTFRYVAALLALVTLVGAAAGQVLVTNAIAVSAEEPQTCGPTRVGGAKCQGDSYTDPRGDGAVANRFSSSGVPAAGSNADLAGLVVSAGMLAPPFASGTLGYTDAVAGGVTSITITPTVADAAAKVTVNGAVVINGSASSPIKLSVGSNPVAVLVTAQDGITSKTYTIVITLAPSSNSNLSNLALSNGSLTPAFASGTLSYTDAVAGAVTSITVTPTVADAAATVTVNGMPVISGSASAPIKLSAGSNPISVLVTAQDGVTSKTYTVEVTGATLATIPDPPSAVAATAGNAAARVSFTETVSDGGSPIVGYTVISNPAGGIDHDAGTLLVTHKVTGLANGTPYTFRVTAANVVGPSVPSAASNSVTPGAGLILPPILVAAASRKTHGTAGTFDLPLAPTLLNPTTEPRTKGADVGSHTAVFTFDKPVTGGEVTVIEGLTLTGLPTFTGNDMIVAFFGVANAHYLTFSLTDVRSADGGTGGSAVVRIGFLAGDVNGSGAVTLSDAISVNAALAQAVTSANYLRDVNLSGTLSLADLLLVNANLTRALPAEAISDQPIGAAAPGSDPGFPLKAAVAPNLKLPLPANKSWRLTVEIGGNTLWNDVDSYHSDGHNAYYALDFDDSNREDGQEANVPVLAAASGTIDSTETDPENYCGTSTASFGNTIKIIHDGGFGTRYAHLRDAPSLRKGEHVDQGQQIGVVGNTGSSCPKTGSHLHFQVYYNGASKSTTAELKGIVIDGRPIESYTVGLNGYYLSTNAIGSSSYSMSGTIHSGSASGPVLAGVTVSFAGKTTTSSSSGAFSITGITAGTYAFTVSKAGYDTYTNPGYYIGSDQSGLNFYLTPSVSDAALQSGVAASDSVASGGWKHYYIDVPAGANRLEIKVTNLTSDVDLYTLYSAKPTSASYSCRPYLAGASEETCSYTNPAAGRWWAGVSGFTAGSYAITATATAGPVTYSMSGTIHSGSASGPVLAGATVSFAGKTATSGSAGEYTIAGISAGTYAFTVSKAGYATYGNPAYYLGSNQSGLNFYLTPSLSDVALQSGVPASDSVASGGWKYYYIDVPAGANRLEIKIANLTSDVDLYTLFNARPTSASYACRPYLGGASGETCTHANPSTGRWWAGVSGFTAGSYAITATVTAGEVTYSMSGTIHSGSATGPVLAGATISFAGKAATSGSAGEYTIAAIPAGTYAFTVSKAGYDSYTNPAYYIGSNQSGLNFYLTLPVVTYSMSGTIHSGSAAGPVLAGATVSIAGKTATSGGTGTFSLTGITAGTYAFSVSRAGYDTYTNPAYYVGSDQSGLNFYLTLSVNPAIAQTPSSGPPGTTFSQWGTGFTANSTATLHFRKPDGTEYPTGAQTIDGSGTFSITYTSSTSKAPGTYTWWAVDGPTGRMSNTVSYAITVSPVVAQTPMSGHPGTTFAQWGTGFTANSTATLHVRKPDGTEYPTGPQAIDGNGTFSITYPSPSTKPLGNYTWWVVDGPTGKTSNYVTYTIN